MCYTYDNIINTIKLNQVLVRQCMGRVRRVKMHLCMYFRFQASGREATGCWWSGLCYGEHVRRQRRDAGSASSLTLKVLVPVPGSRLLPDIRPGARRRDVRTPGRSISSGTTARYGLYGRPSQPDSLGKDEVDGLRTTGKMKDEFQGTSTQGSTSLTTLVNSRTRITSTRSYLFIQFKEKKIGSSVNCRLPSEHRFRAHEAIEKMKKGCVRGQHNVLLCTTKLTIQIQNPKCSTSRRKVSEMINNSLYRVYVSTRVRKELKN